MNEPTYWNGNGKHQAEYDSLKHLVPPQGQAHTLAGELLRCMGNLYHDWFNNGGTVNFHNQYPQFEYIMQQAPKMGTTKELVSIQGLYSRLDEIYDNDNEYGSETDTTALDKEVSRLWETVADACILYASQIAKETA